MKMRHSRASSVSRHTGMPRYLTVTHSAKSWRDCGEECGCARDDDPHGIRPVHFFAADFFLIAVTNVG